MSSKVRIQPYIPFRLKDEITKAARAMGVSETDVVIQALEKFFWQEDTSQHIIKRCNGLQREINFMQRDLGILGETLAMFIRLYLTHTPEIPDSQKETASNMGGRRYEKFLAAVADQLIGTDSLYNQLTQGQVDEA